MLLLVALTLNWIINFQRYFSHSLAINDVNGVIKLNFFLDEIQDTIAENNVYFHAAGGQKNFRQHALLTGTKHALQTLYVDAKAASIEKLLANNSLQTSVSPYFHVGDDVIYRDFQQIFFSKIQQINYAQHHARIFLQALPAFVKPNIARLMRLRRTKYQFDSNKQQLIVTYANHQHRNLKHIMNFKLKYYYADGWHSEECNEYLWQQHQGLAALKISVRSQAMPYIWQRLIRV